MNAPKNPTEDAIDFRDELLGKNWPNDRDVAAFKGISADAQAEQYVAQARAAGILLGVWSAPQRAFLYPDFQFDSFGNLHPDVTGLLAVLPDQDDRSGWRRTFWLYSPHALLNMESPAAVFARDSQRVLEVARAEFEGDPNTCW
jgi:hypothetical protein